jgi:CubicO group peptidase (beta-lactamase class C family)
MVTTIRTLDGAISPGMRQVTDPSFCQDVAIVGIRGDFRLGTQGTDLIRALALALACAACGSPDQPSAAAFQVPSARLPDDQEARLDSIGRAVIAGHTTPGLAVAVAQGDRIVFERGYGATSVENGSPVRRDTIFRIGSLTKQFTAAAIMRLIEQGRVSLDDSITRFLSNYPMQGHRITVRHLLNHTSGIRDYTQTGARWFSRVGEDLRHEEVVALFRDTPLEFAPGERFRYSNSGYFLLGMIIEEVTGRPYGAYVEQELARPIGLEHTIYCPNNSSEGHARGFRSSPNGPIPAIPVSMTHAFFSAGSLCSTAVDLVRWAHALASGRVVKAASYRKMITPDVRVGGGALPYGYGLIPDEFFGVESIDHAGGQIGFSGALSYYPDSDIAVAVLANQEGANAASIVNRLSRIILGLDESAIRDLVMTPAERALYIGSYDIGGLQLHVLEDGDRLMIQGLGSVPLRLLAQGQHEFRARFDPSVWAVFSVENDRARLLTLHQFGSVVEGRRVEENGIGSAADTR